MNRVALLEAMSRLDGTLRALRSEIEMGNDDQRLKDKTLEDMDALAYILSELPLTDADIRDEKSTRRFEEGR